MKTWFYPKAAISAATQLGYSAYRINDEHPAPRAGWLSPDGSHCISTDWGTKRDAHRLIAFRVLKFMLRDAGQGSDANQRFFHNGWLRKNGPNHYEFKWQADAVATAEIDMIRTRSWGLETRLDIWADNDFRSVVIPEGWERLDLSGAKS
jgi:hypothetical protein